MAHNDAASLAPLNPDVTVLPRMNQVSPETAARIEAVQGSCVDCGMLTGCWCNERCHLRDRTPGKEKYHNQLTPYCTRCDKANPDKCHFCRKQQWCTPPPWRKIALPPKDENSAQSGQTKDGTHAMDSQ